MKIRLISAAAALVLALIGAVLVLSYVQGADQRALAGMQTRQILVVTKKVPAGTPAAALEQFLTLKAIPSAAVADGAMSSLAGVSSDVVSVDLMPGEQLLKSRLVDSSAAETSGQAALPKGLQEVTLTVPPDRAVGGQLQAGETVGIFVTFKSPEPTTHLVFQKVLVTRVQGAPATAAAANSASGNTASGAPAGSSATSTSPIPTGSLMITLALSAPDAEKVVFAQEFGSIWLSHEPSSAIETGTGVVRQGSLY